MSNTTKRILSALVMVSLVGVVIYYGQRSTLAFIGLAGAIVIDELFTNFFQKKRISLYYLLSEAVFLVPFAYFNFVDVSPGLVTIAANAALVLNAILLVYLFYVDMGSNLVVKLGDRFPFMAGVYVLLPMMTLADLVHYQDWKGFLTVLLVVNFGMDTGAWFFGKNFGKHKLWEVVSPKKTIEGLVGGMLTAGVMGGLFWHLLFGKMSIVLFLLMTLLGLLSQLGDLVQSKIKRQFKIKDSSSLIPGHGGVYDRIDSLLFLSPFFAVVVKYFYF